MATKSPAWWLPTTAVPTFPATRLEAWRYFWQTITECIDFPRCNVGAGPVSVALADVNGDEKLDIVAVNRLDNTVSILPGVGDGTFRQAITFAVSGAPVAVAVGDFNEDGK